MLKTMLGHAYCRQCLDDATQENYGILHCQECKTTKVEHVFRNEQIERLLEVYSERKVSTLALLQWIKNLE